MIISSPVWVAVTHLALIPLAWACLWLVLTAVADAAGEDPGRGGGARPRPRRRRFGAVRRPGRGPRRRGGRSRPRGSA